MPTRGSWGGVNPIGNLSCGAPALPCGNCCCIILGVFGLSPASLRFAGGEVLRVGHHEELLALVNEPLLPEGRISAGPYMLAV